MEKTENDKELEKSTENTLICNDTREDEKQVEKSYTCEEKWNILQELQTMSLELVSEKFNVEVSLLKRWMETSVIIREEMKRKRKRRLSSDSNHETDSSSNHSENGMLDELLSQEGKEEILEDFKMLSRKKFERKHKIKKYILYMLIVQKLREKRSCEENSNENSQINYLSSSMQFQEPNKGYTHWELIEMVKDVEDTEKLVEGLYEWYLQMQQKGIFVAEFMLKKAANLIAKALNYGTFPVNNTWLNLWYEMYKIDVHTINKSAEYFDRAFLFDDIDVVEHHSKKHVQEDSIARLEEIDNVGEDLFFWYDDIVKTGMPISDNDLCARAEAVSMLINDRHFYPDIVWLYEWKKKYNIQCAEMEWKLFKYTKAQIKQLKNVKKHARYSITERKRFKKSLENEISSATSSIEPNASNTRVADVWRPF